MSDQYERKLEIFIGATRRDLDKARNKIIESILEYGHIPSGMELWASGIDPLLKDIAKHLERCDVHIIILGGRYGCCVPGHKISFTEWEYLQSKNKRPILAFVLNDDDYEEERKKVIQNYPLEKENENKLKKFRNELIKGRFCRYFKNNDKGITELGRLCANSIHGLLNEPDIKKESGWIRASSKDALTLQEIRENKFLQREISRLREFSVVGKRIAINMESKEQMGIVFWRTMIGRIKRKHYWNLFFESGSTLVYISDQFENLVLKDSSDITSWHIKTNNVITLVQLLLYTDVDVRRFPTATPDPDKEYGAIFPIEWKDIIEDPPLKPRNLYPQEQVAVKKMKNELLKFGSNTLFLASTTSWDQDHRIHHFHGPHIKSHPNMLFKRALYTSGKPVVIFMNADKFYDPFKIGVSYPVFGPDLPFNEAINEYPLAFCIGFNPSSTSCKNGRTKSGNIKDRITPENVLLNLKKLGFDVKYNVIEDNNGGSIIIGNRKFKNIFPV
jgi:hypothetical protein